jgi:hypothetical protein
MGVNGLWDVRFCFILNSDFLFNYPQKVLPAVQSRSLAEFSVTEGFQRNHILVFGVDAKYVPSPQA